MQLALQCWDWGFHEFSFKMHYVIIICLCQPLDRTPGAGSATEQFNRRVNRFNEGAWEALWREAHTLPFVARPQGIPTAAHTQYRKAARAEHLALHGHYSDARNVLMGTGLLDTGDF